MLWFAVIGSVLAIFLPGISILFVIPALLFVVGVSVSLLWKPAAGIGVWLAALATLIIWAPLLFLIELALGFEMPFALAIIAALIVLPWLGPIAYARGEGRWRELAVIVAAGLVVSGVASSLAPSMSEARPRSLNITYLLNTSDNQARVLAGSAERELPQSLAGAFEPELVLPGDRFNTWAAPAPVQQITPPVLQDVVVSRENGGRVVRARLVMNGAYRAILRIPVAAEPVSARINGVRADFADTGGEAREFVALACQGRACDGAMVEIALGADASDDWYMLGQFPGRTTPASDAFRERRGPTATPIQGGDGSITLSRFRPD